VKNKIQKQSSAVDG